MLRKTGMAASVNFSVLLGIGLKLTTARDQDKDGLRQLHVRSPHESQEEPCTRLRSWDVLQRQRQFRRTANDLLSRRAGP